jgi:hypothetical protein
MNGRNFCDGVTADGRDCGIKLPSLPSGVRVRTRCHHHERQTYEERAARRRAREEREARVFERQQERGVLG